MLENVQTKPVDLRAQRSKKTLIDAMCNLIQDRPLSKISVGDLTQEAMVNRSTFYAHFADKYDLFRKAIGSRMRNGIVPMFDKSLELTTANLRTLILVCASTMVGISENCQQVSMGELVPVFMTEMQEIIYEITLSWTENLEISKTEATTLALFTTGAILGSSLLWAQRSDGKQSADELADQMMPLLLDGVSQYLN